MRLFWSVRLGLVVLLGLSASKLAKASPAQAALSADEIIQKAVARSQGFEAKARQPAYTYTKVTVTEELDASGNVKERKEKTYQVSFKGGCSQVKLAEVNGHAPSDADLKKQAENESSSRQLLGSSKSRSGDKENILTPEVVAHFRFKLIELAKINERSAYRIAFEPKDPDAPAHRVVDRFMNRISGTLWIDAEEFEIARANIHLRSEVNFLGGVIGSLKRLAFTMTRTRLADGVWFNTFSSGDFEGRKLLDSTRIKTKSQSTNFRPIELPS